MFDVVIGLQVVLRRSLTAASACFCLAACTLPAEQLTFPIPVKPPGESTASPVSLRKSGVPTSDAIVIGPEGQTIEGTGRFTDHPQPRQIPQSGPVRNGVTLNLVGVSAAEAAKTIIGDMLGASFVVSEKVKARLTLQTSRPVARETLLELFETALQAEGAAIVVDRGVYRILPSEEAIASGAPISAAGATRAPAGMSSEVVQLKFVSAAEMERLIRSIAPRANIARVDPSRNLVVVVGSKSDLAAVADVVSVFDVDHMRGMSFAIHPLESADPDQIAQELDAVFLNDRDGPGKGIVRFIPNKRLKAVLVISSRPEFLHRAKTWIDRLDQVGRNTERQVFVYHVQGRPAGELASLLQRVYAQQQTGASVLATRTAQPIVTGSVLPATALDGAPRPVAPPAVAVPQIGAVPTPGQGAAAPVNGPAGTQLRGPGVAGLIAQNEAVAVPEGLQPPAAAVVSDDRFAGISVVADEGNNSLVITATPAQYRRVLQVLSRIDVTPNQVMLEATIAEVTLNDQLRFGLRWFFQNRGHSVRFSDNLAGAVTSVFPGFSYFLNATNLQVTLNALSSVTDVNIVSSPTLMVLDNKRAQLQVGDEVPVATQSAVSVIAPGSPIVNSVAFRNTGVILSITPRISDHGRVILDVEQEVSDVVPTTSSTIDSPTIQQRRVRTQVAVNDGESIFLAGLIQDRSSVTRDQVPLVGNVPVLGNLFKNKTDTIKRTELLIAITPTVVKNSHQAQAVTAEFRDRLNFTLRPQRAAPPDRREQVNRLVR